VWFVIGHGRRILHFEIADHPAAAWVVPQLREAFSLDSAPRHLIFDRDAIFSAHVVSTVKSFGTQPTRTAFRSPWQNGVAERWVGSVRRELLDHVVVFTERHLRRLLREYVAYYNTCRPHQGIGQRRPDTFDRPARAPDLVVRHDVVSRPVLGGLHHDYRSAA